MLTAAQQHRREDNAARARWLKAALKVTEDVRRRAWRREPWQQGAPPDARGSVGWCRWNVQRDEDFGHVRHFAIGGGPLQMVEWNDGRTLWDELHVLRFVFGDRGVDA
jgi:hypothetical protein